MRGRRSVLTHMFHAGLTKDGRHQATAQYTLNALSSTPGSATEQAHLAHLLNTNGHGGIVHP